MTRMPNSLYDVFSLLRSAIVKMIEPYRSQNGKNTHNSKNAKNTHNSQNNLEMEIKILHPLTYEIGRLAAHIESIRNNTNGAKPSLDLEPFIEIVYKKPDTNYKIRTRIPYSQVTTMNQTPRGLLQLQGIKEKKTSLATEEITNLFVLTLGREENVFVTGDIGEPSVFFVQIISCGIGPWKLDYKLKHRLDTKSNFLSSYILSSSLVPSYSVELEYNGNAADITLDAINYLETLVFRQLFMTTSNIRDMYLDATQDFMGPVSNVKFATMIAPHSQLLRDITTLHYKITVKIDGITSLFMISDGKIYLQKRAMWYAYPCSVGSVEGVWYGRGELVHNKLYPFFVYQPSTQSKTRQQHLDDFFNTISTADNTSPIQILTKESRGPFQSREERCAALADMLSSSSLPNDGCIFYNPDVLIEGKVDIVDYKYKLDNTIDLLAVAVMNDLAFVGVPGINSTATNRIGINFNLFAKDESNKITRVGNSKLNKNEGLYHYIVDTKHFSSVVDGERIIHFHKMIGEFFGATTASMGQSYVFKNIRPDKTDRLLRYKQMGNTTSMIQENMLIQASVIDVATLSKLAVLFDDSLLNANVQTAIVTEESDNVIIILNRDVKRSTVVSNEYTVATQFVHSDLIFKMASPMNSEHYPPLAVVNTVLMLDGGRGQDLRKYNSCGVKYYIITDSSRRELDKVESLFNEIKKNISRTEKGGMGEYSTSLMTILSPMFVQRIKKMRNNTIDMIDWHSVNQYWNDETKGTILYNLSQLSSNGTKLFMTYTDGDLLQNKLSASKNLVYTLRNQVEYRYSYIDNIKYAVNDSTTTLEELYVSPSALCSALESIGYEILAEGRCSDILTQADKFFDAGLHTLEEQESTKKFLSLVNSSRITSHANVLELQKLKRYIIAIRTN